MTMGDKIAVLNGGILQQTGTPDEIYYGPSNQFVAGFIGSPPTNFFDCTLIEVDGAPYVDAGEFRYPLPKDLAEATQGATSSEVVLGVRPRNVHVYREKRKDAIARARLYVSEPLGDMLILDLKLGESLFKAVVSPEFKAEMGDDFWIGFPEDKIYLFDKKTGKALT